MNIKIKKALASGESETVEFKTGFDKNTIETLAAFSNTRGGDVLIGVSDRGEIKGIQISKETVQHWLNEVKQYTSQAIIPDAETIKIKDKNIVILSVPESPIKPVACKGRYYKRIKNSNHQLTASEVADMHLRTFNTSWDYHIDELHTKKDISLRKVKAFIQRANANREVPIQDDPMTVLQKLELIRDGKITYACFLLFMSGESSLSTIELGRFQTPIIIKDDSRLKTDLFAEVEGVMQFVRKHINKAIIVTGRPQHAERWDYHLDAPGGLPAGLTVEKLLKGNYISDARNKKVADAFKAVGLIEKYGSGIKRILREFRNNGMPDPEFREIGRGFIVTVFKKTGEVGTKSGVESGPSRDQVGTKSALSRHQVEILNKCLIDSGITELMKIAGRADRTKFRNQVLNPLLRDGLLEMTIPDKPNSRLQKYRLTVKGKEHIKRLPKR
ncbi:MAG: putative DNA binding domain-containing protein [Nitrospirae bacterium]|nr:putative DNA binding domain-containing protein [Nitrospirota bacterium]